jgi:hypothetical protein
MPIEESPVPAPAQMIGALAGFRISQAPYVVAELSVATALADGPGPCWPAGSCSGRPPSAKACATWTRPGRSRPAPTRMPLPSPFGEASSSPRSSGTPAYWKRRPTPSSSSPEAAALTPAQAAESPAGRPAVRPVPGLPRDPPARPLSPSSQSPRPVREISRSLSRTIRDSSHQEDEIRCALCGRGQAGGQRHGRPRLWSPGASRRD